MREEETAAQGGGGAETVIRPSMCNICPAGCPIRCKIRGGRIVGIEPAGGGLCPKGAAGCQFVYNRERILTPLLRDGERGSGKFRPVSWEEAYEIIAERLLAIRKQYGPESVVFYAGYPKWYRPALLRFANAFGSPNFCTESSTCFQAFALSFRLNYGTGFPAMGDVANCKTLLVWTHNPYHSDMHTAPRIRALKARGASMIVVDPKNTLTAHEADIHLAPHPGTDGALALSMAHVILSEGLEDREFIEKYVHGFEAYRDYAMQFPPERGEALTGVKKEGIIAAARLYATNKPSAIMFSAAAVVHHVNGVQNYRAVSALIAITGNLDIEGGNRIMPGPAVPLNEFGKVKRRTDIEAIGERDFPVWFDLPCEEAQCTRLADYIDGKGPYPIKAVFSMGLNHHMWPKPSHLQETLGKLDFYVNTDLFLSDSSKNADLVLPAQSFFEREQIMNALPGGRVALREPVIAPLGEARNDIQILLDLTRRMQLPDEVLSGSYEDYMNYILEPSGLSVSALRGHPEGVQAPNRILPRLRSYEAKPFATPSGKIELYSEVLAKRSGVYGYDPLPQFTDFREGLSQKLLMEYPLILSTGARKPQFFHSRVYRMSWLRNLEPVTMVEMHPDTAKAHGLCDGDRVLVKSPAGSMEGVLETNLSCHPSAVNIYHGNAQGDANELIAEDYLDPISGFPGFKSYICKVVKADEIQTEI